MPFVSWRNQRVLCTTPPIASSRTRTAVKGESAREWTSTFIFQAENLHMAGSWANSLEKKKLHFSHAVTPPAVTIWALTFFNRFNGYLMLWKISEPVSRISTYKGNSWGTSKSTFFSTNKIHLPPCWKFLKGTLGPPFLLKSAIVTCCLKLNHLHFPNNSITHGMSKTSVKALNNIRAISVQGQFLLKKNRWRHWKWEKKQTKKLWPRQLQDFM